MYTLASAASDPAEIVLGPDGNLWFTERAGRIGRITPAGVITEFAVPTAGAQPTDITVGPDGHLWFTDPGAQRVGRITTSGVITELAVPTVPKDITVAAGHLWYGGSAVGRVTTSGVVTSFPVQADGLARGPDDHLWFTRTAANAVGRMLIEPAATLSATSAAFGTPLVGTTSDRTLTLENTGTAELTVSSVSLTGATAFSLAAGTTCAAATVLAPGGTCDVALTFAPTLPGGHAGTVTIADDAGGAPRTIALSGTGTPLPPTAATGAASATAPTTATFSGLADPNHAPTEAWFEYGTTTAYGTATARQGIGAGAGGVPVSARVGDLAPATTYHVRLVTQSAGGTTRGSDVTFTTADAPPTPPVDPPPPASAPVTITSAPSPISAARSVTIAFTSPTGAAQCRLDRGPWIACASPYTLNGLLAGNHVLTVRAIDASGAPSAQLTEARFQTNPNAPAIRLRDPSTVTVPASGVVPLHVRCSTKEGAGQGACTGTASLRLGRSILGRGAFRAAAGATARVPVKLSAKAVRRLGRQARVTVAFDVRDLAGNRRTATASRVLRRR
ncbi:ASPM-SPD-2-Hydin domain-containing protein [Solirubrobacter pauli]|uniref:ASPM-SPD-2-Hydin domain-containing protein n=1 Tax=Solirubrobacter pauli TaxID=166793 RepID=A0A660LDT3_9ACTN|nr:choice-of-anchor D domain-containing protein [Solirubrobacter pauli]RKQ92789.1 ASPM-SPD-2-Hydin domain-containing protein [Solirubrobacter pauli]